MVTTFFAEFMANDNFPEPPRRVDSKKPIFICHFGSGPPPVPGGQFWYDFCGGVNGTLFGVGGGGGGLAREGCIAPPPPRPPLRWNFPHRPLPLQANPSGGAGGAALSPCLSLPPSLGWRFGDRGGGVFGRAHAGLRLGARRSPFSSARPLRVPSAARAAAEDVAAADALRSEWGRLVRDATVRVGLPDARTPYDALLRVQEDRIIDKFTGRNFIGKVLLLHLGGGGVPGSGLR